MKSPKLTVIVGLILAGVARQGSAQATGTPSFNAPYRAFGAHEFGATLSFPEGQGRDFALEGQYRFGARTWDVGFRGGVMDAPSAVVLAGVEGRNRVITHSEQFPLDGAVVLGVGGQFVSGGSTLVLPAALSLGRRLDVEGSEVSIVPYAQPTLWLTSAPGTTDISFGLGLGADFRLSRLFDARVSIGLGDIQGIAVSAVWLR